MNFAKFLNELNAQKGDPEVKFDPQKEIEEYRSYLNQLYSIFEGSLHPYVKNGQIQVERDNIQINEESLGTYEVPRLTLKLNTIHIQLKPEGTMLIASKGRVRMEGPKGFAKIILMRKNFSIQGKIPSDLNNGTAPEDQWVWRFVAPDNRNFIDVTEDSIQNVIMELVNGQD